MSTGFPEKAPLPIVEKSMMGDTFDVERIVKVERWRFSVENTTDHLDKAPKKYNVVSAKAHLCFGAYQPMTSK